MSLDGLLNDPSGDFKWLVVDRKALLKEKIEYDAKTNVWIPDPKDGYVKATIVSTKGDDVTVKNDNNMQETTVKKDKIQEMNPPKFERLEDMANLTYLNEAAVLHNLKSRYCNGFIYTYSGLFCVVVNPYKRLPIYTVNVITKYRGKRKTEMPPHLFSVSDNAYSDMLTNRENQSILITGESGAGKTENTKKVISYFASVAAVGGGEEKADDSKKPKGSLEDAIVQANPVLEAYGNAKTVRNNNSSRFGKFVRIHFGTTGKIAGADIETYLLEKSRVTYQLPGIERNYHIFYWLLSGQYPDYAEKLLVKEDPGLYAFINQGCLTVDNMDDKEEMRLADEAFPVLGFTEEEKMSAYRCTSAIMQFGDMKFKQRPRDEQAEADGTAEAEKVSHLLGVNCADLLKSLLTPKVKVGTEMVTKGQNMDQVLFSIAALAKAMYARMFDWLVVKVNLTLDTKQKRSYFIGVLDIAGFEIFELNTLEQLLINYTNERLQQFFNHHMFVLEQEEYKKEGIVWEFIDFGMDLQACIELIEKPMGILSILQEQCMFPKATNQTLKDMLYENHLGKSKMFGKPKPAKGQKYEAHFELYHYAGTVGYNVDGWLFKNKDPLNQTVAALLAQSKEKMVASFFPPEEEGKGGGGKKKKGGGSTATISNNHKESLHRLMHNLHMTQPHFVRCLIPNEKKCPFELDAGLVLHQLQCNGVLEGIRICRKGFPSRMLYPEFKQRYSILAAAAIPAGFVEAKEASAKVLEALQMDADKYKLGHTKVFFRAGVLGMLEEMREDRLSAILTFLQAHIRGLLCRKDYDKLCQQRIGLDRIQRNIRAWLALRNWAWWKFYTRVKPLLSIARQEDEMKQAAEELEKTKAEMEKLTDLKKQLEERNNMMERELADLKANSGTAEESLAEAEAQIESLMKMKFEFEERVKELEEEIEEKEGDADSMEEAKNKMQDQISNLKKDIEDMENNLKKAEQEKTAKDNQIKTLMDEMGRQDEGIAKISKEKKALDEQLKKTQEDLAAEEDKVKNLNKIKQKLESQCDDLEDSLEREKKAKADVEKAKRKVEADLKMTQEVVDDLEKIKRDLEDNVKRKDGEISNLSSRLEEEESLVAQLKKKIKNLEARIEELEAELDQEKQTRSKVEKQRSDLNRDLEELSAQLDDTGNVAQAQTDLNKKREAELQKMRKEMEDQVMQSEQQIAQLRKKNNDAVNELNDQLDQASKNKSKIEKERNQLKSELDDMASQLDHVSKGKANAEKLSKTLEHQLSELNDKLDQSTRQLNELNSDKSRLGNTSADLQRQLDEASEQANALAKQKSALAKQLEEANANLEDESRTKSKLQGEVRNLQGDLDSLRDQLEQEQEAAADMQRAVKKAQDEASMWKAKFDSGEGGVSSDVMDDLKKKLNKQLRAMEEQLESAQARANSCDKDRRRLQSELEDALVDAEKFKAQAIGGDRQLKSLEKAVADWKRKCSDLQAELDGAGGDARSAAADAFRFKSEVEERDETIEALRREIRALGDEIKDLKDEIDRTGRMAAEADKQRKRLAMEKDELVSALEDAESALEQEEAKVLNAQNEMQHIRKEFERRLQEKDEDFEATRKNHLHALESVESSLEAETRGKADAVKAKKKLEGEINELEAALDGANRGRMESEKNVKKHQQAINELRAQIEEEHRAREEAEKQAQAAERRAAMIQGEVDDYRSQCEQVERTYKMAAAELSEANDRVSELTASSSSLNAHKKRLETTVQQMQSDLEAQADEIKAADENARRAADDCSRMQDELRRAQADASNMDKARRQMGSQIKELQSRLDESEAARAGAGKRQIQALEQRVHELEGALGDEQRRHNDASKELRKQDKRIKDLIMSVEDERKNVVHQSDQNMALQGKIKLFKQQLEEAEEIASGNLNKARKLQLAVEEAEERADMAEQAVAKLRARMR